MAIEPDQLDRSGLELAAMLKPSANRPGSPESGLQHVATCRSPRSAASRATGCARHWWHRKGLDKKQLELAGLEAATTEFRYFLLSMTTGLLATPDYARESISHTPSTQQAKAVAMKLERQAVLQDRTKRFTFLLTEQAVRYPLVPADAMAMQIDRLASLALQANIRIGVLPMGVKFSNVPLSTFTVYDDRLATIETDLGAAVFRNPKDIRSLVDRFAGYETHAVLGDGARELLAEWAWSFRR